MQVTIRQDLESGTAVEIHCREITSETERLERYIRRFDERIIGSSEGQAHTIAVEQILYIEAVDKKTFLYTPGNVYETDKKLYELEEMLDGKTFFRCSKSVIVNLNKITKLKPEVTRNILATLTNGEVVVISRRNVKQLKALIGLDG
ncbi:MAG: LytTR family transcriptional regulator DNA-binding domain-containing protein [Clostridiales bacterium]|jgi:DNA-binding LytR/AlgR family response regulator|nr:LytTR family transcriptional regulator DNA-binding domain-containing protein [Clostridiales bacterium]MBQ1743452.1 LytTR family transcriptional regulator DNA-binding domain-containing protein [Clostridiales bacterium]MBQ2155820.1 LytTR family transcriptional regulator DNA-binding domain-containing protein [Clostridiales bacterium]MBQ5519237.1 LytTR family transcriptional regulator DNA-binding domain-containing protein [Clostridiales bacterium]MBR3701720.1 LytTR family transcriptional regulat